VKNVEFDKRVEEMGKSFDAHILVLDFSDPQMMLLSYDLLSPVEVTSFAFHPENEKVIVGGCLNGQVITWDVSSNEHRAGKPGQKEENEEDGQNQNGKVMKQMCMSLIEKSHKGYVSDLAFVPGTVKVDRKNDNFGKSEHFVTVSEDGWLCIWDTRNVSKEVLATNKGKPWIPFLNLQLFRLDGSPDLGISKILFEEKQTTTTLWAGSFEGELLMIDWAVRPTVKEGADPGDNEKQRAENVQIYYDQERNWRPVLSVERSPFYPDLVMTVHDFHFCIWKTSLPYP
jgi:WD40 repeat protein